MEIIDSSKIELTIVLSESEARTMYSFFMANDLGSRDSVPYRVAQKIEKIVCAWDIGK